MAVFSNTVFSSTVYLTGTPAPIANTKGGLPPEHIDRYRKYLERLNGINKKQQITEEVIEAAEAITEIPVDAAQIAKIAFERPNINFAKLEKDIIRINEYINTLERVYAEQRRLRDLDDELALMLLL